MNDAQVRKQLIQDLASEGYRPLQEISLAWNNSRIGFEIKSPADSLILLRQQARRYRRYFEKLYLVAGEGHIPGAREVLPHYWGMWAVRPDARRVDIIRDTPPARPAGANGHQKAAPLAMLMRQQELVNVLQPTEPARPQQDACVHN